MHVLFHCIAVFGRPASFIPFRPLHLHLEPQLGPSPRMQSARSPCSPEEQRCGLHSCIREVAIDPKQLQGHEGPVPNLPDNLGSGFTSSADVVDLMKALGETIS